MSCWRGCLHSRGPSGLSQSPWWVTWHTATRFWGDLGAWEEGAGDSEHSLYQLWYLQVQVASPSLSFKANVLHSQNLRISVSFCVGAGLPVFLFVCVCVMWTIF